MTFEKLGTMLLAAVAILALPHPAKADPEAQMTCTLDLDNRIYLNHISCDVVSDNADVTQISINRGRCAAGILDSADRANLLKLANGAPPPTPEQTQSLASTNPMQASMFVFAPTLAGKLANLRAYVDPNGLMKGQGASAEEARTLLAMDPIRQYHYGDKVPFFFPQDCNILEWTITVNNTDWTWKTAAQ